METRKKLWRFFRISKSINLSIGMETSYSCSIRGNCCSINLSIGMETKRKFTKYHLRYMCINLSIGMETMNWQRKSFKVYSINLSIGMETIQYIHNPSEKVQYQSLNRYGNNNIYVAKILYHIYVDLSRGDFKKIHKNRGNCLVNDCLVEGVCAQKRFFCR